MSKPPTLTPQEFREIDLERQQMKTHTKLKRNIASNPLVPIGALLTVAALFYGLVNFHRGNSEMSNKMMRARVAAQGFTILALLGGAALQRWST